MKKTKFNLTLFIMIIGVFFLGCEEKKDVKSVISNSNMEDYLVTFIELGSVKCIPCKMMQPIMDDVEKEFGTQVEVLFYDVWTNEGRPYATQYKIKVIPTQVFLDKNGKEYYRHEGFFPKEELIKILKLQGVE